MRALSWFDRPIAAPELWLCLHMNRYGARRAIRGGFALVSRLGDGVFWYTLMAALPLLDGWAGLLASLHLAVIGLIALGLYRGLKQRMRRPRPFAQYRAIVAYVAPLDEFSFPSGHTLHAVSFSLVATYHYPALLWVLWPFAVLVGLSRVVLGLHYPSDVLAATVIGAVLAQGSIAILG